MTPTATTTPRDLPRAAGTTGHRRPHGHGAAAGRADLVRAAPRGDDMRGMPGLRLACLGAVRLHMAGLCAAGLQLGRLRLAGLALLAMLLAAPAAPASTLIARCEAGAGASFVTSPLAGADIALTLGPDMPAPPQGGATLILTDDAPPRWSRATPRDIHAQCGGEGTPVTDIFPPFRARDGLWRAQITDTQVTGCPAAAAGAAAGMAGAANAMTIDWPEPFSPAPLFQGHARFRQTALMRWRGVLEQQDSDAVSASVIVHVTVRSATRMDGRSTMTLRFAPMLAQMMGGTGTCRAVTTATYDWEG